MTASVAVTKMHGTLNDFIVVDLRSVGPIDLRGFALRQCDRRGGIGADGVLCIEASRIADARVRVFNADGSEAEMCGNGMRCVARYLTERGEGEAFRFETQAGTVGASVLSKGHEYQVRVNVGIPKLDRMQLVGLDATVVSIGNPHVVLFASSLADVDLAAVADSLGRLPSFPGGTNVHVAVRSGASLDVRHWERGVGATLACGTGAVACAAAAMARELVVSPVEVRVPGGRLRVEWDGSGDAYLLGPAVRVFDTTVAEVCEQRP